MSQNVPFHESCCNPQSLVANPSKKSCEAQEIMPFTSVSSRFGVVAEWIWATNRNLKTKNQRKLSPWHTKKEWGHWWSIFPLCTSLCWQSLCPYIGVVVSVKANTLENTSPCLRIKKVQERSCCVSPQQPDFSGQVPDLGRPHDFVWKLLSPHFKVFGQRRLPATAAERRMLCFHIIRSRTEEQRKQNKNVRRTNKRRGSWEWQIKVGGGEHNTIRRRIWKFHKVTESFFQIKSSLFLRCTSWQWPGNKEVSSRCTVMFYIWSHFLLDADRERWGIVARSCLPQEGSVIWRILSGMLFISVICRVTNPMKQLQPSSSWVTVVTGPTNPLTHLLDRYLALDSISWVWLGRDKRPLLRLWYPNERGSEAYVWFWLGVKIRDKRNRVLISDIGGKEISLRALVEMYHDTMVNDV